MRRQETPEGRSVRLLRVGEQVRHILSELLQREVAHRVRMKYAAKLKFVADESFDEGTHIDRILRSDKVAQDLEGE
jgi:ribosome-binding factor A